jgi:hypothetical protein
VQYNLVPVITAIPSQNRQIHVRQATDYTSTYTYTIGTVTISTTSTRIVVSTVSAQATSIVSTTTWRTETSVVNAAQTTTARTTVTRSQSRGGGGGTNDVETQSTPGQDSPKKGLSKGAQVGIGAGTAGGSLIICIILGFICRRRRKSRKERNLEMIDNAVTTAMAAQQNRVSEPSNRYSDGKHISTAGVSMSSSHPHSPTPPLHSSQQPYFYPPPRDHTPQLYNNQAIPESSVDSQSRHSFGPPRYEGSEVGGTPIQRYELQQFSSPVPMHAHPRGSVPHSGPYPAHVQQSRDGIQRGYSDLPEMTTSDLPEVRASDLPEVHHR